MLPQFATDLEIQKWVWRFHRFEVELRWIADCRRECGLPANDARASEEARLLPCPPEKRPAIRQALRHFGMLPPGN